ncbi:hypothetical protein [Nocardia australiensis]|uniref:hypothetical protein n=1 Tax=Nocardia australiensis TaxID=2887191 RepID=UPI001D132823|nr:hypothetical protein [Nocardia australiensis]
MHTSSHTGEMDFYGIADIARPEHELFEHLDTFIDGMRAEEPYVVGFPGNLEFRFARLAGLLDIFVNNVGDRTPRRSPQ